MNEVAHHGSSSDANTDADARTGNQPHAEPWKRRETLAELYLEGGLSQYDIAERFGVTQQTISYWFDQLGIEARSPDHCGSPTISKSHKPKGKIQYHVPDGQGGRDRVYRHQLVALLDHAPDDVFAEDTHIHHEMGSPAAVDIPANLDVLGDAEHVRLHQGGAGCPHPEAVLHEIQPQASGRGSAGNEGHNEADD